tara:strand:- start:399 stop:674 length:276 start_codon:yes stop_codon:yes gene_type:complete
MDFLEDYEMYNKAMENAYSIITKRKTLDDVYYALEEEEFDQFFLPFDPIQEDGRTADVIDMVIDYFIKTEEYEKCAELTKIKEKCLKIQTD